MQLKRHALRAAMLMTSFAVALGSGVGVASAAPGDQDSNNGILNNNDVLSDINLGLNVCGVNIVALLNPTSCHDSGNAAQVNNDRRSAVRNGDEDSNNGILNNNDILSDINAGVNVCGVNLLIAALNPTSCHDSGNAAQINNDRRSAPQGLRNDEDSNNGILNNNEILSDINAGVNICGVNALISALNPTSCHDSGQAAQVEGPLIGRSAHRDMNSLESEATMSDAVDQITGPNGLVGSVTSGLNGIGGLGGLTQ